MLLVPGNARTVDTTPISRWLLASLKCEAKANFFFKCRDRVLLDCSANLKVDEVEEDPDDEVKGHLLTLSFISNIVASKVSLSPGRH